jgi:hypothetical protein
MAVTVKMYGLLMKSMAQGKVDFENHELRGMLCTDVYVPNQDTHQFKNSINNEVVGSGYAAGGLVIPGPKVISYTGATNLLTITCGNLVWPSTTISPRYLVVYDNAYAAAGDKPLILYVDFGETQVVVNKSFYYNWPGGVLCKFVVPV